MPGKKYTASLAKVDRTKRYRLDDALGLLGETKYAKWDETVDVAVRLGVDPKQGDQMVRGVAALPHGLGKKIRVVVFAKGDKQNKAIATPDMMGLVSRLGKVLGPRGLMPNPKLGTVTFDLGKAVTEVKAGQVEYKVDKGANVHVPVGKASFGKDKLKDNIMALIDSIVRAKPATSKGVYLRSVTVSTTLGPGIKLDPNDLHAAAE
jgi:large subunit ribosomal protein L1